jgi:hypothetical protein
VAKPKCVVERLVAHAKSEDECWGWPGSDSGNGYGRISVNGKTRATHIVMWELYHGELVPEGMVLDHKCRNRLCYNPSHLRPIPGVENTLIGEGPTAKNARKTHCKRGHELAGDNLITRERNGRQHRECKACRDFRAKQRPPRRRPLSQQHAAGG